MAGQRFPPKAPRLPLAMTPAMRWFCRKGRWPVNRYFIFLVPLAVIAGFWLLSRQESKLARDPSHKSFFERNGTSLGVVFICLVTFWTLFLVVLPYLYMVQESFHPRLPPLQRGGPTDFLTIQQYKSFFVEPTGG